MRRLIARLPAPIAARRPIAAAGRYHPARTPVESEAAAPLDYRRGEVLRPIAAQPLIERRQINLTSRRYVAVQQSWESDACTIRRNCGNWAPGIGNSPSIPATQRSGTRG